MRTRALLTSLAGPLFLVLAAGSGPCGSLDMGSEPCMTDSDCGGLLCCAGTCASTCLSDAGGSGTSGSASSGGGGTSGTAASGTGTSGSSTGATTTGGSTGALTTSGGSSGGVMPAGPYVGYDAGPATGPVVDVAAGCTAARPIYLAHSAQCVQCLTDADCSNGLVCDLSSNSCEVCSLFTNEGCPSGQVCDHGGPGASPTCIPPCADAGPTACNPGVCRVFTADGGSYSECDHSTCGTDSDCLVDGGGVCNLNDSSNRQCMACRSDGGGCTTPGDVCNTNSWIPYCQPSCRTDAGACPVNSSCSANGLCAPGCVTSQNCGGSTPACDNHPGENYCVACFTSPDCPDYAPGCVSYYECGYCAGDGACNGQHCSEGVCSCESDSECPADAPTCIGLDAGGLSGLPPLCGCTDSSQCQTGYVCETRNGNFVRNIAGSGGNGPYSGVGGICLSACNQPGGTDCANMAIGIGTPYQSLQCNQSTGYCVQCQQDSDCPTDKPNCLLFANGLDGLQSGVAIATGGGVCGCSGTAACVNDEICVTPAAPLDGPPTCQAACTVGGGPNACSSSGAAPFCDSWTGLCVGCLGDYDCTGALSAFNNVSANSCDTTRDVCIQCRQPSDCPARLPGCSTALETEGTCGYCQTTNDCPAGMGYQCTSVPVIGGACVVPCTPGDDAGLGTVSDAGLPCPTAQPYCTLVFNGDPVDGGYQFLCSECLSVDDSSFDTNGTCDSGFCAGTFCIPSGP